MTTPDFRAQTTLGQLDLLLAELLLLRGKLHQQTGPVTTGRPGWPIRRAGGPDQPAASASI